MQVWAGLCFGLCVHLAAAGMLRGSADAGHDGALRGVRIDVNTARVPELMVLPGIGRHRAEAIVLYRVRHGPYRGPDDLLSVDGIGPGILAAIRPHIRTGAGSGSDAGN